MWGMNILSSSNTRHKLQHKKWQKDMYIKKIKKRYQKENQFPHDIVIEFQEQSDHIESNRDFSHFVWYSLVKSTNNTLYAIKEISKIIQVIMI